jgi:hypothetical protein
MNKIWSRYSLTSARFANACIEIRTTSFSSDLINVKSADNPVSSLNIFALL